MLVDDDPTNRAVAAGMLGRLGIEPTIAANGLEALNTLRRQRFDLVLMDCQMPLLDGYAVTEAVRAPGSDALQRDVPIIALTANAMSGDRARCLRAGMSDYLQKPVRPKLLESMLLRWRGQRHELENSPEGDAADAAVVDAVAGEAAPPSGAPETIDIAALLAMFDGDKATVLSLLEVFSSGLEEQLRLLEEIIAGGCALDALRLRSHTIKGSSGNFGAWQLHAAAAEMEQACVEGNMAAARRAFLDVREACHRAREAVAHAAAGGL